LGVAIAAMTLFSAFVVPEVRRKILGLSDPPLEIKVELQSALPNGSNDTGGNGTDEEAGDAETQTTAVLREASVHTKNTPQQPVDEYHASAAATEPRPSKSTPAPAGELPIVFEPVTSAPPATDTFAAQLNDILTQADPRAMLRRPAIEGDLLTSGGVVERIDQQHVTLRVASGQRISFAHDASTLIYSDAARLSGDQLRVGDRVYVQWFRRADGVPMLYTIRVTHIF
jgi:hypothetical protein